MHLDDGAIKRHRFDLDPDDLLLLQGRKDSIQYTSLNPSIHSSIDRMPVSEAFWQTSPLAAVFSHIQDGVEHLQIGDAHIAALARKVRLYPTVLGFCDFHD